MSLNEQATDPVSHTSVRTLILNLPLSCHLQNPMVDTETFFVGRVFAFNALFDLEPGSRRVKCEMDFYSPLG